MWVKHVSKFSREVTEQHETSGLTISDVLSTEFEDYDGQKGYALTVCVNDQLVIQRLWSTYKLSETDVIELISEPKGAAIPFIIKTVVSYALSAAVGYLTAPKQDNYNTTAEGASIHQASGRANTPRLGSPPAEIFGQHRYWPDLVNPPFRQYENNVQYLYVMLSAGVGVYDYDEIKIGDTSIENLTGFSLGQFAPGEDVRSHEAHRCIYTSDEVGATGTGSGLAVEGGGYSSLDDAMPDDIEYDFSGDTITAIEQVSDGLGGFVATPYNWTYSVGDFISIASSFNSDTYKITDVTNNVITVTDDADAAVSFTNTTAVTATIDRVEAVDVGEWIGPYQACPDSEVTATIMLDFLFQGGLGVENSDGGIDIFTIQLDIEWKGIDEDDTAWTSVIADEQDNTRDDIGKTVTINTGRAVTPEVRVRRVNASSDSTKVRDSVLWTGLKAELPLLTKSSYDDVSTLAIRIRGDETLSASAENQINTLQTRHLSVWDGTQWLDPAPTREIAPVVSYLLLNSGHPESVIRKEELLALDAEWQAAGQQFNGVFDTATTLNEALERVLQCGFAKHYLSKGQVYIISDKPQSTYGVGFTADNTTKIVETGSLGGYNEYDGIEIEYTDPDTWLPAFVECYLPDSEALNLQAVRLYGCTDIDLAYRFGMRKASEMQYLKRTWSVDTELEGLNVSLGDKCTVPNRKTVSGWCEAYSERVLTLSHSVNFDSAQAYFIGVKRLDGSLSGPYLCSQLDEFDVLLNDDLDFEPVFDEATDKPLYVLGTASDWSMPVIAKKIAPTTNSKTTLTFVAYDERIFDYDNATAPVD